MLCEGTARLTLDHYTATLTLGVLEVPAERVPSGKPCKALRADAGGKPEVSTMNVLGHAALQDTSAAGTARTLRVVPLAGRAHVFSRWD